jgi:hypothetical protein
MRRPLGFAGLQIVLVEGEVDSGVEILIVQNYIEQRAVDLQTAVVVNETQFPEAVHEKTDSRTSRADHFGQHLLTDFGDHSFRIALLAEMSEQ